MSKEESMKKKVIVKWKAYVKMLKHVLRFGSNAKSKYQFKEVMGVLIGKLGDKPGIIKDVIIEDAVPVSHGGHVEVAFKPEDYASFSVVDSEYAEKGLFSIGWYHSHPGLGCFFSNVDVRNQMGWQGPNNSAVGLVFDHTRLAGEDGDMGFDAYRLDDPQNPMSDYHQVNWIVEPPEDKEFYKEGIVELINNLQSGDPPILEINEVPDVFGDFEVPGQRSLMTKQPELSYDEIKESLEGGIEKMSDLFIKPLLEYLNEWARSTTQMINSKNVIMLQNIKGFKEKLSKSMADLQSWFKFTIKDNLRNIWVEIDDKYDENEIKRKRLKEKIDELSGSLEREFSEAFTKALADVITKIVNEIGEAVDQLKSTGEISADITNSIASQKAIVEQTKNEYQEKIGEIKTNGMLATQDSVKALKDGLDPVSTEIDDLRQQLADIKMSLKAISGMVKGDN